MYIHIYTFYACVQEVKETVYDLTAIADIITLDGEEKYHLTKFHTYICINTADIRKDTDTYCKKSKQTVL